MQRRERQLHLGLDPDSSCDPQIRSGLDGVPQERRLADAGLATHDQRAALARANGRDHLIEQRALGTAPAQARETRGGGTMISHEKYERPCMLGLTRLLSGEHDSTAPKDMKQTAAIRDIETDQARGGSWLFLTNHMHVLASISRAPDATIRQTATTVGISERAAAQIIKDLEEGGYLTRTRIGRRNQYLIHRDLPLRHPMHGHRTIGELLDCLNHGL
jgi:hypothetical protein